MRDIGGDSGGGLLGALVFPFPPYIITGPSIQILIAPIFSIPNIMKIKNIILMKVKDILNLEEGV